MVFSKTTDLLWLLGNGRGLEATFTIPHLHHLGYFSFDYLTGENQWDFYTTVQFEKIRSRLHSYGRYKNLHIAWLANRLPAFYEERLTWIFPAWFVRVELEVLK